jgi:hypothetical protein
MPSLTKSVKAPSQRADFSAPRRTVTNARMASFIGLKSVSLKENNKSYCKLTVKATSAQVVGRRSVLPVVCRKVALLGAAGGIGQPLALLLKMNTMIDELTLYDIANVKGVAADLSHCNTPVKVRKASFCFILL